MPSSVRLNLLTDVEPIQINGQTYAVVMLLCPGYIIDSEAVDNSFNYSHKHLLTATLYSYDTYAYGMRC